jgi:hypothetical protein
MITVRQDVAANALRDRSALEGGYVTGNAGISNAAPGRGGPGTGVTVTDNAGNTFRWRESSSQADRSENNDFRVQTVADEPAWIQTGQSVPVANRNAYLTRDGAVVQDTIQYHDVTSGFYVIPRLSGDNVTLLVTPSLSRADPRPGGAFAVQNIETTVRGRLGEWISVGGVEQTYSRDDGAVLSGTRRRGDEIRTVLIKVDEIR